MRNLGGLTANRGVGNEAGVRGHLDALIRLLFEAAAISAGSSRSGHARRRIGNGGRGAGSKDLCRGGVVGDGHDRLGAGCRVLAILATGLAVAAGLSSIGSRKSGEEGDSKLHHDDNQMFLALKVAIFGSDDVQMGIVLPDIDSDEGLREINSTKYTAESRKE
jgi:hypothetical protein